MRKNKNKVARVPVIMQMEALECGAASLAMILAYYGKWVPLEQVRSDCGVSRDGSSAKNVLKAARNYGMTAKGYRYDIEDVRTKVTFPAIIHWNLNHFVVLNGFRKNRAVLNDPARGVVEVSMEEFDRAFTGIVLMMTPSENFEPGGKQKSILEYAAEQLRGSKAPFLFVMLTGLLGAFAGLISPAFERIFLDRVVSDENGEWLYPLLLAMLLMLIFRALTEMIRSVYMLKIHGKMAVSASCGFIWHVLRLPMEFFSQRMAGDIVSRQESNETIAKSLIEKLAPVAVNLAMIILYLVVLLRYSVPLTCIGIGAVLLNTFMAFFISRKRENITRVYMRDRGKLSAATVSGIEMIETIKASGAENGFFERWAGYQAAVNHASVKEIRANQYLDLLSGLCSGLSGILVLLLGSWLIMEGNFTVGMLMAFQSFMNSFQEPVSEFLQTEQGLTEVRTSMERVEDVLHYKTDVQPEEFVETPDPESDSDEAEDDGEYQKLSGLIEMKDVTFGYSKLSDPLIRGFNMKIEPGQKIAFVGTSGCGKSTLARLISGLYRPMAGEILYDGKPLSEIRRSVFTASLAVVDQDIILFEDSISDNIKMWDQSIEDFEMILAARDAQIHQDIMEREGGYSHMISEGGRNFSGGQRQRLEIARMLSQDPTIVILDEATSALDAKTEFEVIQAIKDRGITCIIIAHRLSTIRDCDEIIVMDRGEVVERGTHEELYAAGRLYTQLVSTE